MKKIIYLLMLLILSAMPAMSNSKDTIRAYRLGEVVIKGSVKISKVENAVSSVGFRAIQESDVTSLSQLQTYLPSSFIRTNSRGEALVFIRGAGERQLGLFLDGASINIPWDNRLDLSLVPTDVIGKISVDKNSNSILMGANILGGAVSITSYERASDGIGGSFRMQYTDGGGYLASLVNDGRFGNFNYIANVSYTKSEGTILSADAPESLLHQSKNSRLRTNSDMERINVFARAEYKPFSGTSLGLSVNFTSAEKGVPTEEYLYASDARFWRYSDWNRNLITLNGEQILADNLTLRGTFWADLFKQQINSYDSTYSTIKQIQKDDDFTFGNRIALEYALADNHTISLVFNSSYSDHKEKIDTNPEDEFSQFTYSTGIEYKGSFDWLNLYAGATADGNKTPKTGVYTDSEGLSYSDYGLFVGARYFISDEASVYFNSSRRSRFPTLREAYSGALGKFTVNPNLGAETGLLNDLGFSYVSSNFTVNASLFYNLYDDMIVRITVPKDNPLYDPNNPKARMRDNLAEATTYGFDANFALFQNSPYIIQGHLLLLKSEGKEQGQTTKLEYKPEFNAALVLGYKFNFGLKPQFELEYTGQQYGLNAGTSKFDEIDASVLLNLRLSYNFFAMNSFFEVFARVNNISDEYYLAQLGLPGIGRTFSCGVSLRY